MGWKRELIINSISYFRGGHKFVGKQPVRNTGVRCVFVLQSRIPHFEVLGGLCSYYPQPVGPST